jgi:hypothetical protein
VRLNAPDIENRPQWPSEEYMREFDEVAQLEEELMENGVLPTGMLDFSFCIRYIRHLISTDVLALDGGGHHDASTAQSSQNPAGPLPEPTTSEGVA